MNTSQAKATMAMNPRTIQHPINSSFVGNPVEPDDFLADISNNPLRFRKPHIEPQSTRGDFLAQSWASEGRKGRGANHNTTFLSFLSGKRVHGLA